MVRVKMMMRSTISLSLMRRMNLINSPEYSGKQILRVECVIFSSNKSFLLRNNITDVSTNHLLLIIESNSLRLSSILFYKRYIYFCE